MNHPLSFTTNKIALRRDWDKPIIAAFSASLQRPLDYFGLPGADIQDFMDWQEYLGWKTAVMYLIGRSRRQQDKRDAQLRDIQRFQRNVMLRQFSPSCELRKGQLEDIVLNGTDIDGNRPARLILEKNKHPSMKYELHNWDFQGGLGYLNRSGEAKRVNAIRRCIELQKGHPYLFLLTINVRHTLAEQPSRYLSGLAGEYGAKEHANLLRWLGEDEKNKVSDHCRTALTVIMWIRQVAHVNSFSCGCFPPIYYEGYGREHLLHFVFSLTPDDTVLSAFSGQTFSDVLQIPLLEAKNGQIWCANEQHPGFQKECAARQLEKLNLGAVPILGL